MNSIEVGDGFIVTSIPRIEKSIIKYGIDHAELLGRSVAKILGIEYKKLLILFSPWAPHIVNELYEVCNFGANFEEEVWPKHDESKLVLDIIEIPVQVNGKLRGVIEASKNASQEEIITLAKQNENVSKYLTGEIRKVIFIPGKIFNVIV